jgi:hypothetical protein
MGEVRGHDEKKEVVETSKQASKQLCIILVL